MREGDAIFFHLSSFFLPRLGSAAQPPRGPAPVSASPSAGTLCKNQELEEHHPSKLMREDQHEGPQSHPLCEAGGRALGGDDDEEMQEAES